MRRDTSPVTISLESPDQPEIVNLIAQLDLYQDSLYPSDARHAMDLLSVDSSHLVFAVARDADALAVGCGAIVIRSNYGEVKRMFVRPQARGCGVASRLIERLEAEAHSRGCCKLMLETGPYQPEALALYAKHDFERCSAFGEYAEHPLSVFMSKSLSRDCVVSMHVEITPEDPDAPEAKALLDQLSDALVSITGDSGRSSFDPNDVRVDSAMFVVARDGARVPVGCGAFRPLASGIAEVKRMFAAPGTRGVGAAILRFLEHEAAKMGYVECRLSTRLVNTRAVNFYERNSYHRIPNFGKYVGRTDAVCFAKRVTVLNEPPHV